jgi:hypothetical protein
MTWKAIITFPNQRQLHWNENIVSDIIKRAETAILSSYGNSKYPAHIIGIVAELVKELKSTQDKMTRMLDCR